MRSAVASSNTCPVMLEMSSCAAMPYGNMYSSLLRLQLIGADKRIFDSTAPWARVAVLCLSAALGDPIFQGVHTHVSLVSVLAYAPATCLDLSI